MNTGMNTGTNTSTHAGTHAGTNSWGRDGGRRGHRTRGKATRCQSISCLGHTGPINHIEFIDSGAGGREDEEGEGEGEGGAEGRGRPGPGGCRIASAAATGTPPTTAAAASATDAALTALITASDDGTVRIWGVQPRQIAEEAAGAGGWRRPNSPSRTSNTSASSPRSSGRGNRRCGGERHSGGSGGGGSRVGMGGSKEGRCAKCLYSWRPGPHQRVIYVTALPLPSRDAHGSMDHWMCTVTVPEDQEEHEEDEGYRDDGGDEGDGSSGKCASVRLWVPVNSLSDFLFELDSQWMPGTPRGHSTPRTPRTPRTPQTRSTPRTPRASQTPKTPLGSASLLSPSPSPAPHASCTTDQTRVGSSKAIQGPVRSVKVVGKAEIAVKTVKTVKVVKALPSSLQRRAVDGDRKRRMGDGDNGGDGVGDDDDDDDEDIDEDSNEGGVNRGGEEGNGEGEDALYQLVEVTEKTNTATAVKYWSPGSGQGQWKDSGGGVDTPISGGERSANLDASTGSVSEGARLHTSVRSMYV